MRTLFISLILFSLSTVANSTELLYFFDKNCGACQKFDREVGYHYDKTREGNIAPITKVEYHVWREQNPQPYAEVLQKRVIGTPTFVMVHEGKEIDRLTGYSNDELFWLAMQHMLYRVEHHADNP
jgi:thioredoxin-related protein